MTEQSAAGVLDVIGRVLTERGPLPEDDLIAELKARGVELGGDPVAALEDALDEAGDGSVSILPDDRWVWLPSLLAERVFTHRVSGLEVEHDVLETAPDLAPVASLTSGGPGQRLADGSPVRWLLLPHDAPALVERGAPVDGFGDAALALPAGTIEQLGVAAGELVGVRVTGEGLVLDVVGAEPGNRMLDEFAQRLIRLLDDADGQPVEIDQAIWECCADDPGLFTQPAPPLGEVLQACGFATYGDWLAPGGFDFNRWAAGHRRAAIARRHDLDEDQALAVLATVTLYERVAELHRAALAVKEGEGEERFAEFVAELTGAPQTDDADSEPSGGGDGTRATVKDVLSLLAEPAVAEAVLAEVTDPDPDPDRGRQAAAALGLFAETLEALAPREARAALRWLRGKAHERLGEATAAEAAYLAAESLDPDWPPALVDLARYASDRGDAGRGLALLRRAGAGRDPLVELLEQFHARPRPGLGRNQPCWCGSGVKYKKCHLGRETAPLAERAGWLYRKAGAHLAEAPRWRDILMDTAHVRAQHADTPQAYYAAVTDPLISDLVLFEAGGFADFLAARGELLPDDERLLGEQWLLVDRSVYEITELRRGAGFTARDLRTGDIPRVRERAGSRQLNTGDLICARIVPVDADVMQIFGGIEPVALHQRDDLIKLLDFDPDPVELAEFLTRRFAPPVLRNAEGEPLVLCEATLQTQDPTADSGGLGWPRSDGLRRLHPPSMDGGWTVCFGPGGGSGGGHAVLLLSGVGEAE